ncbi:IQ calmodulin-binding motif-containing protein 1 [Spea bombifrons]|uniref:IQ calmodulin-binding motif-containing protein 1 n=1 Tax=Spea bombifrons TaxID=233779 RepID=UPI00234B29B2|nr:IQ calmodulin-binding motif-containing protein 1 [Spea bombifrons]
MAAAADRRVLALASEITESSARDVPVLLLKLKEFLSLVPLGSGEQKKLKEDLYNYGLIQYCVLVLKQDYSRVPGSWATAASISDILSGCCVGLDPNGDAEEFYKKLLPSAVQNMLVLGRRIQARFVRSVKDKEKGELLRSFRLVMDSLCRLFRHHTLLTSTVLQQEHFLQLLMTDDVETGSDVMSVLQSIMQVNSAVLSRVPEDALHSILDELVYKLSASSNPVTGHAATRSLLRMLEAKPDVKWMMAARYKGLRSLLSRQWTGKGFGRELSRLLDILCSGSYQQGEMQRLHQAARSIQAVWRGFQTRRRVRKLPVAVTTLQRSFRAKKEQELLSLKRKKEEEDLKQQLQLQRVRAMRMFREKQLSLLEIVSAGQMDKHIQGTQETSALLIQKHWRGHRERKRFQQQKALLKQYKAAVTIQRAALRFLEKRRKIRDSLLPWKQMRELTDEQRLRFQQKIDTYVQLHPAQQRAAEQSQELHLQAQEKLGQRLLRWKLEQDGNQRREAMLAQINTHISLLTGAPSLRESSATDVDVFTSRSVPVALKAREAHSTMLRRSRWPWWRKLGEEFTEEGDDLLNAIPDMELGTLFIAGTNTAEDP